MIESEVRENLLRVTSALPEGVTLCAVSKYHSQEEILCAYHQGQRIFAENHVQEMVLKHKELPQDIQWHMIGHLQTNKVRQIAPFVSLIQSVDSMHLLEEINLQAQKAGRVIPVLLEIHLGQEESKTGLSFKECLELLNDPRAALLTGIRIEGVMGMASHTDDRSQIPTEFRLLKAFFIFIQTTYAFSYPFLKTLSMGMSGDYDLAVESGSNMVRVGTGIFGERAALAPKQ